MPFIYKVIFPAYEHDYYLLYIILKLFHFCLYLYIYFFSGGMLLFRASYADAGRAMMIFGR